MTWQIFIPKNCIRYAFLTGIILSARIILLSTVQPVATSTALRSNTVDSKIIRALEIIRVKKSYLMQFFGINICQVMIIRFCTVYNKHDYQIREKSQVHQLLQVLSLVNYIRVIIYGYLCIFFRSKSELHCSIWCCNTL